MRLSSPVRRYAFSGTRTDHVSIRMTAAATIGCTAKISAKLICRPPASATERALTTPVPLSGHSPAGTLE
jgi:hypothetical protein